MDKNLLDKIKQLREITGAPIGKCKEALEKTNGDLEKAQEYLRKIGESLLEKKKDSSAGKGIVEGYVHFNGRVGALIELRSETDFVSKSDDFKKLAHEIALQVATMNPLYISKEQIPEEVLKEKELSLGQDLEKWLEEVCLLEQSYIKNSSLKIKDLISEFVNKFGEKIEVKKIARLSIDE